MTTNEKQYEFTRILGRLLSFANAMELDISLREVQRFPDRQRQLVAEGTSQTLNSKHLKALAADIILFENGQPVWDAGHKDYLTLGEYWENLGGTWGGRWSFKDAVHFKYKD